MFSKSLVQRSPQQEKDPYNIRDFGKFQLLYFFAFNYFTEK